MSSRQRALILTVATIVSVFCVLSLVPDFALAARGHAFGKSFGEPCTGTPCGPGQFNEPAGVAVNESTGDVYVADKGDNRVEYFNSEGAYLGELNATSAEGTGTLTSGSVKVESVAIATGAFSVGQEISAPGFPAGTKIVAVNALLGELQVSQAASVSESAALVAHQSFSGVGSIAVDNSCHLHEPELTEATSPTCHAFDPSNGDLYVPDGSGIAKFNANNAYIGQVPDIGNSGVPGGVVAVDAAGNLWISMGSYLGDYDPIIVKYTNAESNVFELPVRIGSTNLNENGRSEFAVDSEDDLYVGPTIYKLSDNGQAGGVISIPEGTRGIEAIVIPTLLGGPVDQEAASAVAVELASNDSYIDNVTSVGRFNSSGVELERFGAGELTSGEGIGVSSSLGEVYVADSAADKVDVFVPEPPRAPTAERESVTDISADSATFQVEVNPRGEPTEYHFEYGPCATPTTCAGSGYERSTPVTSAGSEFAIDAVTVHVQELSAGTAYHVRMVAENSLGRTESEETTFKTQALGGFVLPDGRKWEMVSPPHDEGALIEAYEESGEITEAAAAGEALTYLANVPTELAVQGFANQEQVFSRRGPDGWVTGDLGVAHNRGTGQSVEAGEEYRFFSEDLSRGIVQPLGAFLPCRSSEGAPQPCLSPDASEQTAFVHTNFLSGNVAEPCTSSCYTPLVTGCPPKGQECEPGVKEHANVPPGTVFGEVGLGGAGVGSPCGQVVNGSSLAKFCGPYFDGATADANHVVLNGPSYAMEEWNAGVPPSEQLQPVALLPRNEDGEELAASGKVGLGSPGPENGAGPGDDEVHAISNDGSRIFWSTQEEQTIDLYMRENADRPPSPGPVSGAGTLAAGSASVTSLKSAAGTGTLTAPTGTATLTVGSPTVTSLVSAGGRATLTSGSTEVTSLATTTGEFVIGEPVSGTGIPAGTMIVGDTRTGSGGAGSTIVGLTLSAAATVSGEEGLASEGPAPFAVGQAISGAGIPAGTTIAAVGPGTLTLSADATASGGMVAISAFSSEVTSLAVTAGRFLVGQPISGSGIPADTTIVKISGATVTLSAPVTASGIEVLLSSEDPVPAFLVGQTIVGAGIPAGTTIAAVTPGMLTLSARATASGADVSLHAFDLCTDIAGACSIQIGGPGGASFEGANAEGSRVFFSGGHVCEIMPNEATGELECAITNLGGRVVGASENGSYVYIESTAGLELRHYDSEPGHEGWEAPRFIASGAEGAGVTVGTTSRVSPNGQWLAFVSKQGLTGYDTRDALSGQLDREVYLYDAQTGGLACASCDPTGARPIGVQENKVPILDGENARENKAWFAGAIPTLVEFYQGTGVYQPRYLSDSGRLFFDSPDTLVPQAINDTLNVYEYEPEGVGSETARCGPAATTGSDVFKPASAYEVEGRRGVEGAGCVALISSGGSSQESAFMDASETGGDVFFMTTAQLTPQDFQKGYTVYDAHECTSASPCTPQSLAAAPECTTADACRAAPTPQPSIFGAPSSATFSGIGNLTPTPAAPAVSKKKTTTVRCRRGFVKKHGRCVKVKTRKHTKAKRSRRDRRAK